ncbi:MAG: dihydroorotase [Hyphomicrobiaceae bacterium]|nr:dihydroorotase [Hyphomicrobiaceae bacterium]
MSNKLTTRSSNLAYDLILRGGTVVNHEGMGIRDIAVKAGRIACLGDLGMVSSKKVINCKGLHILPGVIDSQVHFREPGLEHKENLQTGSRAAVAGGVTTVFDMPNTAPPTTNEKQLVDKLSRAHHRMFCDFAFYIGGTSENIDNIPELEKIEGSAGIKVFMGSSTGSLLLDDKVELDYLISRLGRRAAFHAEDETRLVMRQHIKRVGDSSSHPEWRDSRSALIATERLVQLAEKHKRRVHILHISTGDEMDYLRAHRQWVTAEVTPNHLTFSAPDCYRELGTYVQMNPPVRNAEHQKRIWQAVVDGTVDVLGSDHAPHTREEKGRVYPDSYSGMPGVQTLVPIMLDHVNSGRLSLARFVDLTSHGPQRVFGITSKGRIAIGYDADFTVVDLKRQKTITDSWIESKCGWTPYNGVTVTGWPVGTFVRGHLAMWEGEILLPARGESVRFQEGGLLR